LTLVMQRVPRMGHFSPLLIIHLFVSITCKDLPDPISLV